VASSSLVNSTNLVNRPAEQGFSFGRKRENKKQTIYLCARSRHRQPRSFRPIYDFEKEELQVKTGSLNERLKNVGNVFFGHKKGRLSPKG
jgi:hypothetical protein